MTVLDQPTFHERYEAMPPGTRAELIGGAVYVASPVKWTHGRPHHRLLGWLSRYEEFTPGVEVLPDTTAILGEDSEPQPDAALRLLRGQSVEREDGYIVGLPEFVAEVASSSESYDLNAKLRDYERYGAKEYLALIVRTREPAWFNREGKRLVRRGPDADGIHRSTAFPGLWLDAAALFRDDAKRVRAVLKRGLASAEHKAFAASLAPPRRPKR